MAEHTGGMIALIPADADRTRLAVDGGDASEELHLTLAYLGDDVTGMGPDARDQLLNDVSAYANATPPVTAEVMGHAAFNPHSDQHDPCAVYLVSGPFERDTVTGMAALALGDAMPEQHPQFIPHITVAYGNDRETRATTSGVSASVAEDRPSGDGHGYTNAGWLSDIQTDSLLAARDSGDTGAPGPSTPRGGRRPPGTNDPADGRRAPHVPSGPMRGTDTPVRDGHPGALRASRDRTTPGDMPPARHAMGRGEPAGTQRVSGVQPRTHGGAPGPHDPQAADSGTAGTQERNRPGAFKDARDASEVGSEGETAANAYPQGSVRWFLDRMSYTGPVTFDRVRVAIAGDHTDYPLGGTTQEDTVPEETMADTNGIPVSFPVLAVEGLSTSDGRFIEAGALDHRPLPLPILAQTQTPVGGGGHDGANVIGRIDTMNRVPGPTVVSKVTKKPFPEGTFVWQGSGYVDPNAPATALAQKGYLTGNSVDLSEVEAFIEADPDNPVPDDDADGGMKIGGPSGERMRLTKGVIAATTLVAIPAFADAYMLFNGEHIPAAEGLAASATPSWRSAELGDDTCLPCAVQDLDNATAWDPAAFTASADPDATLPPIDWFRDPGLSGPTPLTVDDDGRVYGHLAAWNTCHTGFTGKCVMAPRSRTDYAHFRVGVRRVADDNGQPMQIGVGSLTVVLGKPGADGHADRNLAAMPAAAHYDNIGSQVANVEVGEDAHGIWVAGALRSTATPEQVDALLAAPLSGDWRPVNGHLELVAALGVNTPGFPIPRARVASGQVVSLVAAGAIPRPPVATAEDALADKIAARVLREMGVKLPRPVDDTSDLAARRDAVLTRLTEADLEGRFARAVARLEE